MIPYCRMRRLWLLRHRYSENFIITRTSKWPEKMTGQICLIGIYLVYVINTIFNNVEVVSVITLCNNFLTRFGWEFEHSIQYGVELFALQTENNILWFLHHRRDTYRLNKRTLLHAAFNRVLCSSLLGFTTATSFSSSSSSLSGSYLVNIKLPWIFL